MTLILSADGGRFCALSDIVTVRDGRHDVQIRGLPLVPAPVTIASDSHTVVGLAQKTVRYDSQRLLQWAGSEVIARHVWTHLASAVVADPNLPFLEFVNSLDLSENELQQVSLIHNRVAVDGRIDREALNAKRSNIADADTIFAGTGEFHFLSDMCPEFNRPEPRPDHHFLRAWFHRIGYVALTEAVGGENFMFAYGGWFEITVCSEGRFRKIPYLVKLWSERNGEIKSGPCLSGWYANDHLCLQRAYRKGDSADSTIDVTIVPDALRRSIGPRSRREAAATFVEGELQVHLVLNKDGKWAVAVVGRDESDFRFRMDNGKVEIGWGDAFRAQLQRAFEGPHDVRIRRPFTDQE